MTKFGIPWQEMLRCDTFPIKTRQPPAGQGVTMYVFSVCLLAMVSVAMTSAGMVTRKRQKPGTPGLPPYCEAITMPMCSNMSYTEALYPTSFGHQTQEDASFEIRHYDQWIGCSARLTEFLCLIYAPPCTGSVPTRALCEEVRQECDKEIEKVRVPWEDFRCEQYPSVNPQNQKHCGPIVLQPCKVGLSYNMTSYPIITHNDALPISPLLALGCSSRLKEFYCLLYAPPCDATNPTREVCEDVRRGCEGFVTKYGMKWPGSMACDRLPPSTYRPGPDKRCRPIHISTCTQGISYNMTSYPILNHHEHHELSRYSFLILSGRCPRLREFLCLLYAPPCDGMLATRELCEEVKQSCAKIMDELGHSWPERMKCGRFPPAKMKPGLSGRPSHRSRSPCPRRRSKPTPGDRTPVSSKCPPSFVDVNGVCYHVAPQLREHAQMTWADARTACRRKGNNSDLVSFDGDHDFRGILKRFGAQLRRGNYWTGATYIVGLSSPAWIHNGQPIPQLTNELRGLPLNQKLACGAIARAQSRSLVHTAARCDAPYCKRRRAKFGYVCRIYG